MRGSYPHPGVGGGVHLLGRSGDGEPRQQASSLLHEEDKTILQKSPLGFGVFWKF
jgi:hypothetical protein